MRAKNIENPSSAPVQDWSDVVARLDEEFSQESDPTGAHRRTTWLTTVDPDGSPQVTPVGAVWVDGAFCFQTGDPTRKAKNLLRDPRCAVSVSTKDLDLVLDGTAEKVTDPSDIALSFVT